MGWSAWGFMRSIVVLSFMLDFSPKAMGSSRLHAWRMMVGCEVYLCCVCVCVCVCVSVCEVLVPTPISPFCH